MDTIRIKNLRGLVDTGDIELKPLTFLAGTNSSGKSTFIRTFPLLKQSIETATASPILWFGRYVDFGSIHSALSRSTDSDCITFSFGFTIPGVKDMIDEPWALDHVYFSSEPSKVELSLVLTKSSEFKGSISSCEIRVADDHVRIDFQESGFVNVYINGRPMNPSKGKTIRIGPGSSLIPNLIEAEGNNPSPTSSIYQPYSAQRKYSMFFDIGVVTKLAEELKVPPDVRLIRNAVWTPISSKEEIVSYLTRDLQNKSTKKRLDAMIERDLESVRDVLIYTKIFFLLRWADDYISSFFSNVTYMGPLRATAQRYYRTQDLAVRDIDFRGENLAMFLRSLSPSELKSFSGYTSDFFGFTIDPILYGEHIELRITEKSSKAGTNLADMGFGYSQLLPIVAQSWSAFNRSIEYRSPSTRTRTTICMEQPELHLHPAHQAKIADMFEGTLRASRSFQSPVRIVAETHSEAMINQVGQLIRAGSIDRDAVQILLFERRPGDEVSTISTASYDDEGALVNWPFGFFAPLCSLSSLNHCSLRQ